jgi:hypothetical protein
LAFEHHEAGEVAQTQYAWNEFIEAWDPGFWFLMAVSNDVNVWENPCSSGWQQFSASLDVVGTTVSLGMVAALWADGILSAGSAAAEAAEGGGDSGEFWQALKDQWAARDDTGSIGGYGKSQVPSWVFNEGYAAEAGETPVQAATRIMNEQYGAGNWSKGPGTEFNQIVKWVSRTGGKP